MRFATAKVRFGRVVVVTPEGCEEGLLFRPLDPLELEKVIELSHGDSHDRLELVTQICEDCHLGEAEDLDRLIDEAPLFVDKLVGILIAAAQENHRDIIREGVKSWRATERSPGEGALNILALLSYKGGQHTKEQFAGALMLTELLSTTKGISSMMFAYLKAMGKRRGR